MKTEKKHFTIDEVERLVKKSYDTGFCDGKETTEWRDYKDSDDFWSKNKKKWKNSEITYSK